MSRRGIFTALISACLLTSSWSVAQKNNDPKQDDAKKEEGKKDDAKKDDKKDDKKGEKKEEKKDEKKEEERVVPPLSGDFKKTWADLPDDVKSWLAGSPYLLAQGGANPDRHLDRLVAAVMRGAMFRSLSAGGIAALVVLAFSPL